MIWWREPPGCLYFTHTHKHTIANGINARTSLTSRCCCPPPHQPLRLPPPLSLARTLSRCVCLSSCASALSLLLSVSLPSFFLFPFPSRSLPFTFLTQQTQLFTTNRYTWKSARSNEYDISIVEDMLKAGTLNVRQVCIYIHISKCLYVHMHIWRCMYVHTSICI